MTTIQSNLPRVTEILQAVGLIDLSKVNPAVLSAAQKFGTAVHRACELFDKNNLNLKTLSQEIVPFLNAWKRFCEDYNLKFNEHEIEHRFVSKLNFTGKPDRYYFTGNTLNIIDIKCSNIIYPATSIQLAAYEILILENLQKKCYVKRKSVLLIGDNEYKVVEHNNFTDKSVFLSSLNIYFWRKNNLWKN